MRARIVIVQLFYRVPCQVQPMEGAREVARPPPEAAAGQEGDGQTRIFGHLSVQGPQMAGNDLRHATPVQVVMDHHEFHHPYIPRFFVRGATISSIVDQKNSKKAFLTKFVAPRTSDIALRTSDIAQRI